MRNRKSRMKSKIHSKPVCPFFPLKRVQLIVDLDLSDATISSLTRLLRDELAEMCEARGIEVGGTKPHLAKALLEWVRPSHTLFAIRD